MRLTGYSVPAHGARQATRESSTWQVGDPNAPLDVFAEPGAPPSAWSLTDGAIVSETTEEIRYAFLTWHPASDRWLATMRAAYPALHFVLAYAELQLCGPRPPQLDVSFGLLASHPEEVDRAHELAGLAAESLFAGRAADEL